MQGARPAWLSFGSLGHLTHHKIMDLNREIIKSPLPIWVIIACAVLSGVFFSLISVMIFYGYDTLQLVTFFCLGVLGYLYIYGIYKLAKHPSPWLHQYIGLLTKIGGAIVAATILWNIFAKK